MNSSPASAKTSTPAERAARQYAARSLTQTAPLGLADGPTGQSPKPSETRLAGAYWIPLERIAPDPTQPRKRIDEAKFRELVASVREHGILQPISVRQTGDGYILISGERRLRAAREAGLTELPCWVQSPADDAILVRQIVENWQRADLHPFETADTLARLRDERKLSQRQIARQTGKPESEISRFLALLKLSPDVQRDARADVSGDLGRRHLVAVAQLPADEQRPMLEQVRARHMSADETERAVQDQNAARRLEAKRGAPRALRTRYLVGPALVEVTFRRKQVSREDICTALERALAMARNGEAQ